MLINAVSSSKTVASMGKCTWRSGWYLARRSRMAALQGKPRHHFALLVLLSCNTTAERHKACLRSLPGCIFMISNSFIRTVSKSCSLMLHRQGMFVDSALERFDSKRYSLILHHSVDAVSFG